MEINQALVEKIKAKARDSELGLLGEPETPMTLDIYSPSNTSFALAMVLVGGFHEKYDLVSIVQAAIEVVQEECEA